ncbi:MAG: S66 peptidase family protein [Fusobacteriaceae bacterium]
MMIEPKKLKKGDKVALIGTSGFICKNKLKEGIEFVKNLGLEPIVGESCNAEYGYLSGSDKLRAGDLNRFFNDKTISGIFCMRGGYGATRILDLIDYEVIKRNPKIFIGYSDITALHIAFNQKSNLVTYHSPMPSTEFYKGVDEYTLKSFLNNIMEEKNVLEKIKFIKNPKEQKIITLIGGKAQGELIGGNLTLIASLMGTPYEIDTRGKILFLEDIDEEPYRIDRMLTQLRLAGKFQEAAGIILGAFTNCEAKNPGESLNLEEVIADTLFSVDKPVVKNLAAGHCLPTMTLPLGKTIRIDTELEILEIIN